MAKTKEQKKAKKDRKKANKKKAKTTTMVLVPSVARMPSLPSNGVKIPKGLVEKICALTDPFCNGAKGSKWPDAYGESTMAAQIRGHTTMSTLANGGDIMSWTAAMNICLNHAGSQTASVYTMNVNNGVTPGYAATSAYLNMYRIVSAGLIIRNVCPALSAGGYLIVTRQASMLTNSQVVAAGNVYGVEVSTHPICAGMEVPVIFRELGSASRSFQAVVPNATTPINSAWDTITIEIVGGPAATVMLDVENVFNIEFTLAPASIGLQQFLPLSPPPNKMLANVADKVSTKLSKLAWTGVEAFGRAAVGAAVGFLTGSPAAGKGAYKALGDYQEVD